MTGGAFSHPALHGRQNGAKPTLELPIVVITAFIGAPFLRSAHQLRRWPSVSTTSSYVAVHCPPSYGQTDRPVLRNPRDYFLEVGL